MTINDILDKATPVLKRHDVEFAALFGSYARGEARENSDVDFLIRYSRPKGLEHFGVIVELEKTLGKKVDVVTESYIYPLIKSAIAQDLKVIYGQRRFI